MPSKGILVCLLAVCLALLAFPSQVAAANPILVITSTSNPYTTFLPEILNTEGFNEFDSADISTVSSTTLTAYDLAILGDMTLTAAQASMFSTWVNAGGNLIAMHPDPQLAGLLGLADSGSALQNAYVLINTAGGPGVGLVGQTIQFHGPAELYVLNGATSYATLYSNASTPTSNPGVTLNLAGAGQAAAFSYDLARSVVYTRQGNPAWSGQARDAANTPPIRAYDLFFGAASFDPEPDWIDFNKIQIPQADEQQRLLANLILQMNGSKKPLPRFWYLPSGFKAAVIMTGDDHGSYYGGSATKNRFSDFVAASPSGCSVANWTCVRGTAYLFPKIIASNTLTNSQISSYISQGFEIGVHVDSATDCQDWTTTTLDTDYANYLASLASQYPSAPAPQTHRMHCVSWSDYDSQPTIELKHGIRLDTTYYYYPSTWINDLPGLFTGSGMPMRYADRNGNLINVYQATTQMTDESGQSYPQNINTLLDNALSGTAYYGVFTANMHNDQIDYPGPGAAAIVSSAQARGVPVITALQMLQWLDGRNGSSFTSLSWSGNVLSFSVTVGTNANNLRAMLPANFGSLGLTSMVRGSTAVSYQLQVIKGVQYAVFAATAGSYKATYGGPPLFSISGALIPGAVSSGATVAAIGPVTVTATADNYGNYFLNGLPSGTYQVTPSRAGINFTPATQTVTITGANVTAVNFDVVETCPCSLWNASSTPANPADADPSATELGVAFRSDVAGNITGIRFYKGSGNTGTHIGNLWTASGTNLATATFSGETASGWQQVNFATPVAIAANTIYIASYHTTTGYYSADAGYFSTSYDNAPLHAVQDGVGHSNGLYRYGASAFPNNTYASTNYWVDVVFSPTTTTFSLSGTVSGPGGGGATITLTGAASASTTADTSGNYSFTNLPNGTYTVTPGNSGFSFTPASQLVAIGNANATGVNFATATYTISGNVSGAGGSGATVSLSGPANATVTADASGNFSFTGLLNGAYTVTPSKTGFTFTPASLGASVNGANVTGLSFSTVTYSISGTISGPGGVNAVVNLSGAASAATTADASGNYSFTGLSNGSYTVMPSSSGVIFTPSSQPATIANGSVTGVNFSTPIPTYTLQGNISGPGGPGATVTLSGASSAATIADGSGNFTFNALIAGSYTITPSNSGFGFSPGPQTIAISNANVTGVSFSSVAAACPCSLWGSSTVPGTVSANDPYQVELGVRFTSDAAGFITGIRFYKGSTNTGTHVGHLWSNTGTLLATATFSNETASGWQQVTFATPVAIVANTTYVASYNTTSGNYSYDQNYFTSAFNNPPLHGVQNGSTSGANGVYIYGTSAFPTGSYLSTNYYVDVVFVTTSGYGIAGTISGPGGSGATVSLTGASTATITADASGNFTFTGLANGAYTVTPTKAGYTFTPASQPVTVSNASVTGVAFSTVGYTISGTISGAGGNGATVNLTGTSTATVTADASGNFTFTGLANGAYTITPSKSGYAFTPASQPVTVSNANVTGISFSTVTYTISGTISGSGGNGATVNLTGTSTATVTADASGNFSFTALSNGAYTVTPSKTGYAFTPASQPVTVSGANVTGISFATATYTISGTISGAGGSGATVNLTGTSTASVTADPSGNFTFTGLANGAYTVTPTNTGFTFTPASQPVTVNTGNVTAVNFSTGTGTSTYSISGTISGSGGNGATVTLTGASSATVTAGSTGTYTFSNLPNGTYTVTPSRAGFVFTPVNTPVILNGANMTANFSSTAQLAIDQTVSTDRSSNATTVVSPAFSTAGANELLLAFVSSDGNTSGITVTGVTGGSLTWTLVQRTNAQLGTAEIWRAFAPTTLTNATVTATLSQSVAASITVVTFTGADTTGTNGSGAIGAIGTGNANPGAPTASLATTRNNSWVFGVGNDWDNAASRTVGAGQTMVHQYLATVGDTYWVQRQTTTTPTAGTVVTINDTAPATDRYNLSLCEVLPAQ